MPGVVQCLRSVGTIVVGPILDQGPSPIGKRASVAARCFHGQIDQELVVVQMEPPKPRCIGPRRQTPIDGDTEASLFVQKPEPALQHSPGILAATLGLPCAEGGPAAVA